MGTDGLWDVTTDKEVADAVTAYLSCCDPSDPMRYAVCQLILYIRIVFCSMCCHVAMCRKSILKLHNVKFHYVTSVLLYSACPLGGDKYLGLIQNSAQYIWCSSSSRVTLHYAPDLSCIVAHYNVHYQLKVWADFLIHWLFFIFIFFVVKLFWKHKNYRKNHVELSRKQKSANMQSMSLGSSVLIW